MKQCVRCIVSGRVQGVWFRASTRDEALRLGLTGHALNLADGSVEVVACGDPAALEQLKVWLWQGPPHADVTAVACEMIDPLPGSGFVTG